MRNVACIWFAKSLSWFLQKTGRHGAALPGLIVEKIHPNFLHSMLAKLPEGLMIISGTNGKTTTTKIITELLRAQGKRVLTNQHGGNFVRGIVTSVAKAARPSGKLDYDLAVVELDEAWAVRLAKMHRPRAAVLLNITRDQLDRFGEIDTTAKLLQKVVDHTTELVILNDDDNRLCKMVVPEAARAAYFGISSSLQDQFPNDEQFYGTAKKPAGSHVRAVELSAVAGEQATYKIGGKAHKIKLQLDGQHNALNAAAALTALLGLYPDLDKTELLKDLSQIKAAFGRGEFIELDGRKVILQLIKNPASFRQALHVLDIHQPAMVAVVINDDHADSRDVSWLWDVDFKPLGQLKTPILTGGTRAWDMANRLKYDEVPGADPTPPLKDVVEQVAHQTKPGQSAIIYTTYTAMWPLRRLLAKRGTVEKL